MGDLRWHLGVDLKDKISISRKGRESYPKEETVILNAQRQKVQCVLRETLL